MLTGAMAGHAATDSVLIAHRARWEALDPCLPDSYRSTLVTGPPCASVGPAGPWQPFICRTRRAPREPIGSRLARCVTTY